MSKLIDLMPRSCREVLGRRALMRRWALVYGGTIAVLAASYWAIGLGRGTLERERDSMAEQVKLNWSRSEVVQNLLKEINEVESAITRYNRLAWPIRVTEAIDAVGAAVPGDAALTEITITPREEKKPPAPPKPGAPKAAEPEAPDVFMVVEMQGVAPSDKPVAEFVSGLEANPLFVRVSLDYTRSKELGKGEVREFRVTCEIDLSVKYSFTPRPDTGGFATAPEEGS